MLRLNETAIELLLLTTDVPRWFLTVARYPGENECGCYAAESGWWIQAGCAVHREGIVVNVYWQLVPWEVVDRWRAIRKELIEHDQ